uniref:FCP1 homology domain-containing protein n=1 Tax=Ciona savignyi TaxID=51511 RepID=H2Z0J7_CIOSA
MKIMMMGTTEENLVKVLGPAPDVGEVINDFDIGDDEDVKLECMEEHLAKIERRVKTYEVKKLNDPRKGKKLLVLDVDYTLFDHRSNAEKAVELMRPYLHEFLTRAYVHYDIVIWCKYNCKSNNGLLLLKLNQNKTFQYSLLLTAATSMKWIEVKMKELGVTSNPNYKIAFFMDHGAMITVHTPSYGVIDVRIIFKTLSLITMAKCSFNGLFLHTYLNHKMYFSFDHDFTKPLGVIWGKYPEYYSSHNTIMFDDLRRNFLMNPQSGLKIRPFKNAHMSRSTDVELHGLSQYLEDIADLESFSLLKHKRWESYHKKVRK